MGGAVEHVLGHARGPHHAVLAQVHVFPAQRLPGLRRFHGLLETGLLAGHPEGRRAGRGVKAGGTHRLVWAQRTCGCARPRSPRRRRPRWSGWATPAGTGKGVSRDMSCWKVKRRSRLAPKGAATNHTHTHPSLTAQQQASHTHNTPLPQGRSDSPLPSQPPRAQRRASLTCWARSCATAAPCMVKMTAQKPWCRTWLIALSAAASQSPCTSRITSSVTTAHCVRPAASSEEGRRMAIPTLFATAMEAATAA